MAVKGSDERIQVGTLHVKQAVTDSTTWARLDVITGAILGAKQYGLVIERIEYYPTEDLLNDAMMGSRSFSLGFSTDPGLTLMDPMDPRIVDVAGMQTFLIGSTVNGLSMSYTSFPLMKDFTALSGGGILVPADRVYFGLASSGLGAAQEAMARMWFRTIELNAQGYLELLQMRIGVTT